MAAGLALALPATFGAAGAVPLVTAGVAGATGLGAIGGLTLAGSLVSIGGSLLLSAAVGALTQPDVPAADPANIQLNLRQSIGDRIVHIGRVRVGGTVIFYRTAGGKFFRVIVHGHGEMDGIEAHILDKKQVSLDGSGFITEAQYVLEGTQLVQIQTRLGEASQTYYGELEPNWAAWDAAHRGDGLFTSLTVAQSTDPNNFRRVYPNGEPPLELIARGRKLRDPRASTAWSDNAALAIAHLIEDTDGFNLSGVVDDTVLTAAADDADDDIPLAVGGTEKRWRAWGSYSLTAKPGDTLKRMLAACQGQVQLLPTGKVGIHVGALPAPTVTLGSHEVISVDDWTPGPDALDRYTELPFRYVDPTLAYTQVTGDPWVDTAREAANGGEAAIGHEADYSFAPSHTQARRAAQEQIERDCPDHIVTITFQPSARRALYDRVVLLDIPELPSGYWWRVKHYALNLQTGAVTLVLWSYVRPTWSTDYEGQAQAMPDPAESGDVPQPTNAKAGGSGVDAAAGISVVWDPRPSVALEPVLEYAVAGSGEWDDWPLSETTRRTHIAPLVDGDDYDLRLAWQTNDGIRSAWVEFDAVTASTDTALLAAPSDLDVTDDTGGDARVSFTTISSDRLWKTEVLRDGVVVAETLEDGGEAVEIIDPCGAGTFDWTLRSVDLRGDPGAESAVDTQTIT